jgi:hypothetical protein
MTDASSDDPYSDYSEGRIKHLDMVQAVVARLGGNGFVVKGWAITIAGAFLGFAITRENGWLALAAALPTLMFWFLDATFLRSERAFRLLFEEVRSGRAQPFFMNATAPSFLESLAGGDRSTVSWKAVVRRPSLKWFYGALILSAIVIAVSLAAAGGNGQSPRPRCRSSIATRMATVSTSLALSSSEVVDGQIGPIRSPSHLGTTCR